MAIDVGIICGLLHISWLRSLRSEPWITFWVQVIGKGLHEGYRVREKERHTNKSLL